MPIYSYQKEGFVPPPPESIPTLPPPTPPAPFKFHPLPTFISIFGLILIIFVVWPILSYEIAQGQNAPVLTASGLLTPNVDSTIVQVTSPKIVSDKNFTQINTWFPTANLNTQFVPQGPSTYLLSIPKLKIQDAIVTIGSQDLSESLIQYPDTALPGELGSPVVFGHSILPQFYNPKNYISIFSLLPTLQVGDELSIVYDNVTYTYQVTQKQEVNPEDLWVLKQEFDAKRLKLITCVPPGLKTRRLVVTANLTSI